MSLASVPLQRLLIIAGCAYFGAVLALVLSRTPLGSPLFLTVGAVTTAAYAAALYRVWTEPHAHPRLLLLAFGFALLFRIPPAVAPVGSDSDMVRYLWDGRVQTFGYNPYRVVPNDPALVHTHTDETAAMPSRRHRTPYPPAAQMFFRLVVMAGNSTMAMKIALVLCDVLAMLVLWRWLVVTNGNQWLALAYAWHPLVILEVAHSGHIDALGTLWIAASAYWLARRCTALASLAFVLAVGTKLLPIVLAPLFVKRVRMRDIVLAGLVAVLLYMPFIAGTELPLGAVPNVVANIRFNGPVFYAISEIASPLLAAGFAVTSGLAVAAWARWRLAETDPAAWAWPMAVALACAPVIYPWYLLYLTPFLFSIRTLPLTVWTFSVIPVYLVWHFARAGARWRVPPAVLILEYALPLAAAGCLIVWATRSCRMKGRPAPAAQG